MNESKVKIELIFRKQDFENIYFQNNSGSIFWSASVKQYFIILLIFAGAFIMSLVYSLLNDILWGLPIFLTVLVIIASLNYAGRALPILKWKRQVFKFLDRLDKIKKHELYLSNDTLTAIEDEETTIIKWSTFTKAILNDESISLFGDNFYLFPKKSMGVNEYAYLKEFISEKLENGGSSEVNKT